MSDPVTNVEIEDVLSSIRRLVSDDTRVRPVGWGDAAGEAADQDTAAPEVGRLVLTPALRVTDAPVDAAAGLVAQADRRDPAAPPEQVQNLNEVYVLQAHQDAALVWDAPDADNLPEPEPEAEPEREGAQMLAEDAAAAQSEPVVFASTRDGGGRGAALDPEEPRPAQGDAADDRGFLLAEDETVLDEETLRELVAEIVRQELQGALGERITRNVRKLVRREIQRALTSHELE